MSDYKIKHRPQYCEICGKKLNPYSHRFSDGLWICDTCENPMYHRLKNYFNALENDNLKEYHQRHGRR